MTDFIREVDEDLRQDRFRQFLNRYWYLIAIAVVLVLGGVGGWKALDYLRTQKAETASGQYLAALDLARDGKSDETIAALKAMQDAGTPGYQMLARFRLAGELGAKDPGAAVKMFDDLAASPAVEPALQSIARLRAALLLIDTEPYPALKARLDGLADANSPVRNPARELLALTALKANQIADAGKALDAIQADPTATVNLRQRATLLQALVRTAPDVAAPASVPPAPAVPPPAAPAAEAATPPGAPPPPPFFSTPDAALPTPAPAVAAPATPDVAPTAPVAPPAALAPAPDAPPAAMTPEPAQAPGVPDAPVTPSVAAPAVPETTPAPIAPMQPVTPAPPPPAATAPVEPTVPPAPAVPAVPGATLQAPPAAASPAAPDPQPATPPAPDSPAK